MAKYWPKYIPGDEIIEHFKDKDMLMQRYNDEALFMYIPLQEPYYTMMLMATYGTHSSWRTETTTLQD